MEEFIQSTIGSDKKGIIFFLCLYEDISCGYSLEALCIGASNKYHNICFHKEIQSTLVISNSLISNNRLSRSEKSGPCLNTESYQRATKYCGKEEKLLLRSNFSPFLQYFQYIS